MRSSIFGSGFVSRYRSVAILALMASMGLGVMYSSGADRFGQIFRKKRPVVVEQQASKVPVARCLSKDGSMLRQESGSNSWKTVAHNEELNVGDLILSGMGSQFETLDGSIKVTFRGDIAGTSPFPIRETAIRLVPGKPGEADFHLCFERGRIEISNGRKEGSANCHVSLQDEEDNFSELKLNEPGSTCTVEIIGRWPKGTHFDAKAKDDVNPVYELIYVQMKGTAEISDEGITHQMSAPPGPAMLTWNSQAGMPPVKTKLEKLPEWTLPPDITNPEIRARIQATMKFRDEFFGGKPMDQVLESLALSDDIHARFVAVNVMLATDQLPLVYKVVGETKHKDVIDNIIIGLRHWIGRKPGQDKKLHQFMMSGRNYSAKQAEIFVDLLHSFSEDELRQPETFEALIDYLESERTGIRGLAHWHLYRLVPKGRSIDFDPTAPADKRKVAVDQWKKLVPKGKIPPRTID